MMSRRDLQPNGGEGKWKKTVSIQFAALSYMRSPEGNKHTRARSRGRRVTAKWRTAGPTIKKNPNGTSPTSKTNPTQNTTAHINRRIQSGSLDAFPFPR